MAGLRVLISGGGTGGHIYPALAIADAIKAERPDAVFLFVGAEGKMEMQKVPANGYKIEGLPVAGFHRQLDARNFAFPIKLLKSLWKARTVVKSFAPNLAIGTGGYASGPALATASLCGVPIYLQEQNALAGVTNRILGKFAKKIFVAYEETDQYFNPHKLVHTGNPLRSFLHASNLPAKSEALHQFKLDPTKTTLLCFGGSLGAKKINEAFKDMFEFWQKHSHLQVIWQTGQGYYDTYSRCQTAMLDNVCCLPYLERMDLAYAAADLVACRAGALSISELQLLGKPALLIPSPNVSGDHQTANAKAIEKMGAAVVVPDHLQKERLEKLLPSLLEDKLSLDQMSKNMSTGARPDASSQIAKTILKDV